MGKRVDMSALADDEPVAEAKVPTFALVQRPTPLDQIAPNPLNTRNVQANPERLQEIADSMRENGQLQPCTVVTRSAFLNLFPEHADAIGAATYVQVTGGRRYAAAAMADLLALDIIIKDQLADSRERFLAATAEENIHREDLDPIEEARAVFLLVQETGQGQLAAQRLSKKPPWVTIRLNLLKLDPDLQELIAKGEVPLRDVRDLHKVEPGKHLATLQARRQQAEAEKAAIEPPLAEVPPPPPARETPRPAAEHRPPAQRQETPSDDDDAVFVTDMLRYSPARAVAIMRRKMPAVYIEALEREWIGPQ